MADRQTGVGVLYPLEVAISSYNHMRDQGDSLHILHVYKPNDTLQNSRPKPKIWGTRNTKVKPLRPFDMPILKVRVHEQHGSKRKADNLYQPRRK